MEPRSPPWAGRRKRRWKVRKAANCAQPRTPPGPEAGSNFTYPLCRSWPSGQRRQRGINLLRLKVEYSAVDAIAQTGGLRPVGEDVAQVTLAVGAMHLCAAHAMAGVGAGLDRPLLGGIKARPARAAVIFGAGFEQRR